MANNLQVMTFNTTSVGGHALRLQVSLVSQNIAAATSTFNIELFTVMTNYRHYTARTTAVLYSRIVGGSWDTLASFTNVQKTAALGTTRMLQATKTYAHANDGSLTIDFEATLQTVDQRSSWAFKKQTITGRFVSNASTTIRKGPYVRKNDEWATTQPWVLYNGQWRKARTWVRHNGVWKSIGG